MTADASDDPEGESWLCDPLPAPEVAEPPEPPEPRELIAFLPPATAGRTPEPATDRLPPHDLDAEKAVLGSVLIDRDALSEVSGFLGPADFYRQAHGRIYAAMLALAARREPVDVVTLAAELASAGELDAVGGASFLAMLANDTPTAVHVAQYGRIVAERSRERATIMAAGRIAEAAYQHAPDLAARAAAILADVPGAAERVADPIARLGARSLADLSTRPAPLPLLGRLDPEGPTGLYGEGGCGKGVETASWIVGLVAAGHRVLLVDYECHPGEWARRVGSLGGADVAESVMYVTPAAATWGGRRGPLWVQADELRELATEHGATYIVVDSAVPACGATDPLKPEAAGQYIAGLERIGRPSLTIAHVTKAGDLRMPFGSAFWHNLMRVTWSLARDGETLVLQNRKANAYPWLGRYAVTFTWHDGILGEVSERPYSLALADRIADVLADGPLSVRDMTAELSAEGERITDATLRSALNRARDRFEHKGEEWSLRNA